MSKQPIPHLPEGLSRLSQKRSVRVTLREIAKRAGCSVTLASKILNGAKGTAGASPKTREAILRCAEELGYETNAHAQALRQGRAGRIGIYLGSNEDAAQSGAFLAGVGQVCAERNYGLQIISRPTAEDAADSARRALEQGRIDALISPETPHSFDLLDRLDHSGPSSDRIIIAPATGNSIYAHSGFESALDELCRDLATLGHQRLAVILGTVGPASARSRLVEALAVGAGRNGLEIHPFSEPSSANQPHASLVEQGEVLAQRFIQKRANGVGCTAALCAAEQLALGFCRGLWQASLSIPSDVSVATLGWTIAEWASPALTSIGCSPVELGKRAAEQALRLVEAADGADTPPAQPPLRVQLIRRQSVGSVAVSRQ